MTHIGSRQVWPIAVAVLVGYAVAGPIAWAVGGVLYWRQRVRERGRR